MAQNVPDCTDCKQIFKIFPGKEEYLKKKLKVLCFGSVVGLSILLGEKKAKNQSLFNCKSMAQNAPDCTDVNQIFKIFPGGHAPGPP